MRAFKTLNPSISDYTNFFEGSIAMPDGVRKSDVITQLFLAFTITHSFWYKQD